MLKANEEFKKNRALIDDLDSMSPELIDKYFPRLNRPLEQEQLMALITIIKTDSWMDNPLLFENIVMVLNGISPSILEFEGCSIPFIWYALYIIKKLRPDLQLGELVKGYIEFIHNEGGFYIYPNEAGMKSPVSGYMTEILEKLNQTEFKDFDVTEHQASILTESIEYIKIKVKEDGIN